jgi:hypothetical protein
MLAVATSVAVVLPMTAAVAAPAAPVSAVPKAAPSEAPTEQAAIVAAVAAGKRVEVAGLRSETTQVFAQPDGHLTAESAAVPQRVQRANGQWAPIDLTLRTAADGTLRPGASVADVRFSHGGAGPLVTLVQAGKTLSLTWPGKLPTPTVAGAAATYPNVLPDVDLVVRATDLGFTHVLVVKTPAAAANPKVKEVRFGLGGDARIVAQPDGKLQAIAGNTLIADTSPAVMWDSARPAAVAGLRASSADAVADDTSTHVSPGGAANVADVATTVVGRNLVLKPSAALLKAPAAAFPLYVDPDWSAGKKRWAYATNNNGNNTDTKVARVGKDPEGSKTYRSFFEFNTTFLKSKHVESAYVQMELDHSASCSETWTHMYATGAIASTPRTKWSPKLSTWLASAASRAPEGAGCDGKADQTVNFRNAKITAKILADAKAKRSSITIGFCACNEDGQYEGSWDRWKKFFPNKAKLIVDYDNIPGAPTKLLIAGVKCPTTGTVSIGTPEPTLTATYPDADNVKGDNQTLSATYEWVEVPADGHVVATTPRKTPPGAKSVPANGTTTSAKLTGLVKDKRYAIRTHATDPKPYSITGDWSPWCVFEVDTTVPAPPTITVNTAPTLPGSLAKVTFTSTNKDVVKFSYGWDDMPLKSVAATGTTTKTATVSLTAARYGDLTLYAYASDITQNKGNNAAVEFEVGRPSEAIARWKLETYPTVTEDKALADAKPAVGGDTPLTWDSAAPDHAFKPEARLLGGSTANFDATKGGPAGWAEASVPALDTSKSFSVAAWVRLGDTTTYQTAVSKDGANMSVFRLQYRTDMQGWCFSIRSKDVQDASLSVACAKAVTVGKWTHLAGVYDENEMLLKLYINGKVVATTTPTDAWKADWAGGWNATGPVVVGRALDAKYNGTVDVYSGQIADVQVFNRALVDQDLVGQRATDEHSNGFDEPGMIAPIQVGQWDFNAATLCYASGIQDTCKAPDAAAWSRQLTLTPGVEVGDGLRDNSLILDGTHFAEEPDPLAGTATREFGYSQRNTAADGEQPVLQDTSVLRTDQPFTVSAWVRLDDNVGKQTIISQDTAGAGFSGFDLSYRATDNKWVFSMRNGAAVSDAAQQSVAIADAEDPTAWHQVVGVFDPGLGQLRLYVDGELEANGGKATTVATHAGLVPWQSTGSLVVGRSDQPGGLTDWLSGSLDNVAAWQGVMTGAAIHTLYDSESPEVDQTLTVG